MKWFSFTRTATKFLTKLALDLCARLYWLALILLAILLLIKLQTLSTLSTNSLPLRSQFTPQVLAVIVNQADPLSGQIATYYQQQRSIPSDNIISVEFPPGQTVLSPELFQSLKAQVDAQTPKQVQGFVLTWAAPYRVGCMSITTAFATGFDPRHCADSCLPTQVNPYFNSNSATPYNDFQLRPTMAIAATTFEQARQLIDRGVAADGTAPSGTAYLMDTSDADRNVRSLFYLPTLEQFATRFGIEVIKGDSLEGKSDVMFYFTGLTQVESITTNRFRPGAIADHVTSFGGALTDSPQMSSLRWLEAGATGSYGTVVEPCNFPQKFPHPQVLMIHYLAGDTLLEAYWKSVAWTGQGIFIGEPLARPFGRPQNYQ